MTKNNQNILILVLFVLIMKDFDSQFVKFTIIGIAALFFGYLIYQNGKKIPKARFAILGFFLALTIGMDFLI
ncbi:MAG: hypothetical protein ABF242_05125 [Flavobacteriales bacterium]